ncbi:MAG: transporter substrate-binding protein, partial [Pseudohongiella sp.]
RTTNRIQEAYLKAQRVADEDIMNNYTPFSHSDWQSIVSDISRFGSAGKATAVVSTINGDANVPFYRELGNQGISSLDIPVIAFSVGEEELSGIDARPLVGHMAAWNYFQSVDTDANAEFIARWHDFIGNTDRVTNDPMEATYIGFNMWVKAVEKAGTTDVDAVEQAMIGIETPNLSGGMAVMNRNHHLSKPVLIGEIQSDGQFEVVWETDGVVPGDAWSDYLDGSKDLISDWTDPIRCGNYNTVTESCSGSSL